MNRLAVAGSVVLVVVLPGAAGEAAFVEGGKPADVREVGAKWRAGAGYVECGGVGNFLAGGKAIAPGDFTVRARLSLDKLAGTAASLVIGGDHFGLDGGGRRLFVEGVTFGPTKFVGDATQRITPGKPLDVEVARRGRTLTWRIDGTAVWQMACEAAGPLAVALRPWRATMRVRAFAAGGTVAPLTDTQLQTLVAGARKPALTAKCKEATLGGTAMPIQKRITMGPVTIDPAAPPKGTVLRRDLGLLAVEQLDGKLLHEADKHLYETRACITPGGDYLLIFPEGSHYGGSKGKKVNDMMAMRSPDRGRTWSAPRVAFDIDYNQHGFVPLIPKGGKRIYAFGTQPIPSKYTWEKGLHENCPIGYRWSDDDGRTWSKVALIEPANDPDFRGMSVMRMCATDAGTWIIGSHEGDWSVKPLRTRQYLLRSEDRGKTWTVLPDKRPNGWFAPSRDRMDEGRPISLGRGEVFALFRTPTGFLWSSRSTDDGKTWAKPAPTPLVHPDAPPMLFALSDGKTLAAFHHNHFADHKYAGLGGKLETHGPRQALWVALSADGGRTWSEPRFVLVNALAEDKQQNAWVNYQCSYMDAFTDGGRLHLFMPHRWKRALYLTLAEADLDKLPTEADLAGGS